MNYRVRTITCTAAQTMQRLTLRLHKYFLKHGRSAANMAVSIISSYSWSGALLRHTRPSPQTCLTPVLCLASNSCQKFDCTNSRPPSAPVVTRYTKNDVKSTHSFQTQCKPIVLNSSLTWMMVSSGRVVHPRKRTRLGWLMPQQTSTSLRKSD